ncbi:MAG: nucleoside-diphosphate kinase [Patescibacteria group bacterium]
MQTTLIILKPDCIEQNLAGKVLDRFAQKGLKIVGIKMIRLSDDLLDEHYEHHKDKPFFPELKQFMQRTPVIIVALRGENAVDTVRELAGATNPAEAAADTIRKNHGTDVQENVLHASDSVENAEAELKRFFREDEDAEELKKELKRIKSDCENYKKAVKMLKGKLKAKKITADEIK